MDRLVDLNILIMIKGSGKTYTMLGDQEKGVPGLYLLASYDIFGFLETPQFEHLTITISFFEIYCGKLYDLLNDRNQLTVSKIDLY